MKFAKLMVTALFFSIGTSQFIFAQEVDEMDIQLSCTIGTDKQKTEIEIRTYAHEDYNVQFGGSKINSIYVSHAGETVIPNHTPLHSLRTSQNSDMQVSALQLDSVMTQWYEQNKEVIRYIKYYEIPGHVVARFMRKNEVYESWVIPMFRPNHSEVIEFISSDCNKYF